MVLISQCSKALLAFDRETIELSGSKAVLTPTKFYLVCMSLSAASIYFFVMMCCLFGFISAFFIV